MASTSVEVTLPFNSRSSLARVTSASLRRREFAHEILVINTFNHNMTSLDLRTGDPLSAVLKGNAQPADTFVGYIHEVKSTITKDKARNFSIICVGPTWTMKNERQRVWSSTTISDIARTILREHNLTADVEDHPLVIPQINQAGESDWAFLCRIAKQYGFVCYPTGVVVHFHSRLRDVAQRRRAAVVLEYAHESLGQRSPIHEFKPILGDTPDSAKAQRTVSNVNPRDASTWAYLHDGTPVDPTRHDVRPAIFNQYMTDTVATSPAEAQTKLTGQQADAMWNHQADALLDGYTGVQPTSVLYLKGLKGNFDGYWTIIGVEHKYNNRDAYRMVTELGTNDLGPPVVGALPGILVAVDTDKLPYISPQPQLVAPGGLSAPELLAARGGPHGVRWRGSASDVDPPKPAVSIPWFIRRKHRYAGK